MATIVEIEKLALILPETEQATQAVNLLESLGGVMFDEDEGIAEALRRDSEIDANPDQNISLAQLDAQIQSRRRLLQRKNRKVIPAWLEDRFPENPL